MSRRSALAAVATLAAVAVTATVSAPSAAAQAVTTGASGYASSAATGTGRLAATMTLTGAVGGLLDGLISPIVTSALNPLVSALQGNVNGAAAAALGASSPYAVGSPSQQTNAVAGTFPNETFPTGAGCTASSTTQPCFNAASTSVSATPLATIGTAAVRGFTQQTQASSDVKNPMFGRAQVTSASVAVLPAVPSLANPVASAAAVDSKANCPNDGVTDPSTSVSASNVKILNGLVTLNVLNGAIANLVVNGTTVGSLSSLTPTTLAGGIKVQSYGTAVRVDVPLTLNQLLTGLNLGSSATTELLNDVTSASLTLSVVVGPSSSLTTTTAKAWGLGIGADLSGSLTFDLLGLAGARVALPSGLGGGNFGNLADLRLAYTSCTAGTASTPTSTPAVPPANV